MELRSTIQEDLEWDDIMDQLKTEWKNDLVTQISDKYSSYPTIVQQKVIERFSVPKFYNDKYLYLVQAPGGSGKSLSFVIPAAIKVLTDYNETMEYASFRQFVDKAKGNKKVQAYDYSPRIIIMANSKILIEQLADDVKNILPENRKNITITTLYSGKTGLKEQKDFGPILICTHTILHTLMTSKRDNISMKNVELLAADEAESLYKESKDEVKMIISSISSNPKINFIAASATLTTEYRTFATKTFLTPEEETQNRVISVSLPITLEGVEQFSLQLPSETNELDVAFKECVNILKEMYIVKKLKTQVIIFLESMKGIDKLNDSIKNDEAFADAGSMKFDVIHSKLHENKAECSKLIVKKYREFKRGDYQLLLCTDIMAKGIDISNVGLVISIFAPRENAIENTSEINGSTYMHRVARTGRYKAKGISLQILRANGSKFAIPDKTLPERILKEFQMMENTATNNITPLNIGDNYIEQLVSKSNECVKFNKEQEQK